MLVVLWCVFNIIPTYHKYITDKIPIHELTPNVIIISYTTEVERKSSKSNIKQDFLLQTQLIHYYVLTYV